MTNAPFLSVVTLTVLDVTQDHDGGRGVYFEDPDGHLLEIITRPYGSAA